MHQRIRHLTHAAIIAALYAALCHLQNLLLPGSASMAIQFRVAEALCVLAFFTPAAISGLSIGCLVFNMTFAGALPLDSLVGTLATLCAAWSMWRLRRITFRELPVVGLLMPAVTNAVLVGWELTVYIGGGFAVNALYVALGELGVLLVLGGPLYLFIRRRRLHSRIFG